MKKRSALDGFAMGATGCDGLSVGLKLSSQRLKAGGKLSYELAVVSRATTPRTLVLFNASEAAYRTRVLLTAAGKKPISCGLVMPKAFVDAAITIAIELAPNSANLSDGWFKLPPSLKGKVTVVPVLGGTSAMPCEVRGKPLTVTIE